MKEARTNKTYKIPGTGLTYAYIYYPPCPFLRYAKFSVLSSRRITSLHLRILAFA